MTTQTNKKQEIMSILVNQEQTINYGFLDSEVLEFNEAILHYENGNILSLALIIKAGVFKVLRFMDYCSEFLNKDCNCYDQFNSARNFQDTVLDIETNILSRYE